MAWLNLTKPNFFFLKNNRIFMYLLTPFILQNSQNIFRADPELWGPKCPICPEQNFFGTNHYYYFHLPIGPFPWEKFLKILTADPELWGFTNFGPKMVHLPQTNSFWKIIIILIYLLVPFVIQNLKKFFPADPELWGCANFGPKMAHFPKWGFC